mmetsp:Transcript_15148/g.44271  ORF Transcript_15148/g.44271 Transcript_15148/m.44271 type:complete len:232 (+) Transcript_15148:363-1058(+)
MLCPVTSSSTALQSASELVSSTIPSSDKSDASSCAPEVSAPPASPAWPAAPISVASPALARPSGRRDGQPAAEGSSSTTPSSARSRSWAAPPLRSEERRLPASEVGASVAAECAPSATGTAPVKSGADGISAAWAASSSAAVATAAVATAAAASKTTAACWATSEAQPSPVRAEVLAVPEPPRPPTRSAPAASPGRCPLERPSTNSETYGSCPEPRRNSLLAASASSGAGC